MKGKSWANSKKSKQQIIEEVDQQVTKKSEILTLKTIKSTNNKKWSILF